MAPIFLLLLASSFTHHHIIWILYRAETGFSYKLSLACFGIHRALGNYAAHTNCLSYSVDSKDRVSCCWFFKWSRILIEQRRCWRKVEYEVQAMAIRTLQMSLKFKNLHTNQQLKLCLTFALGFLVFNITTNSVYGFDYFPHYGDKNWVQSLKVSWTEMILGVFRSDRSFTLSHLISASLYVLE